MLNYRYKLPYPVIKYHLNPHDTTCLCESLAHLYLFKNHFTMLVFKAKIRYYCGRLAQRLERPDYNRGGQWFKFHCYSPSCTPDKSYGL